MHLNEETALYERLADIARKTALAVQHHDGEAVSELLVSKKNAIGELRPVSETTDRLRRELGDYQEVSDDMRARASEALKRARSALEVVLGLERENEESLRVATGSIRAELIEIAHGRRLLEGYGAMRQTEPLFMDKRR